MKNIQTIIAALLAIATSLLPFSTSAQSPEKMSYQAVIRDGGDNLAANATVGMQISILQGGSAGTAVYTETHTPTTNINGLVSIEIGAGSTSDDFSAIDWANGPYFIKSETDPSGGTNYTITGISQLLSVPYALFAGAAAAATETDPVFDAAVASGITSDDTSHWNNGLHAIVAEAGNIISYDGNNWVAKDLVLTTNNTGSGVPIQNMQPSLVLNWCIALQGLFPSRNSASPFIGEIQLYGFNFAPRGFATCSGQLLPISSYAALFSLLGTMYGGDGRTTFGLPDLRGRTPISFGQGAGLTNRVQGQKIGAETITISTANLPAHNHTINISFED
jgi:microcystin-dependent protein